MGLYPKTSISNRKKHDDGSETWTETVWTPEMIMRRAVRAEPFIEERTNCFCCSCGLNEFSDPFCRNHGFAGERPCEVHNMPGQVDEDGNMPASVQERRQQLQEAKGQHVIVC